MVGMPVIAAAGLKGDVTDNAFFIIQQAQIALTDKIFSISGIFLA